MKIVVTVKLVPETTAEKRIDPATKRLVRAGGEVLNPFDEFALEAALKLKDAHAGTTVTVVTLAPERMKESLRKALAMGADDALVVAADDAAGSDVWGTALVLARAIESVGYDLVLCGMQSTDAGTGDLPGALAERLGLPALTALRKVAIDGTAVTAERETDSGFARLSATLPALASVTKSMGEPRYPALKGIMGAKKKPIVVRTPLEVGCDVPIGTVGARTTLVTLEMPPGRSRGGTFDGTDPVAAAAAIVAFLRDRNLA